MKTAQVNSIAAQIKELILAEGIDILGIANDINALGKHSSQI